MTETMSACNLTETMSACNLIKLFTY